MITADEARKISGLTIAEKVENIGKVIEIFAKDKKRNLRTGWDYKDDQDLWIQGGYNDTSEWKEACNILVCLGYKVSFVYKEEQFVDMYTFIEW